MMQRGFLLLLSLALCATTMALIIVSVSTNTWVQQDFAFNDGTGASGTYVIGVLRFCVNLNPNPYYQSACGLVDATCFTDVGTVVAAYFPACTHFNLFRILIALTLGFTILTLLSYLFLLAISHPRIAHMSIIFSVLSMLCGCITMTLFITYQKKLAGTWMYGSSFWMIVVAWLLMFLSIISSSLLHFIYPPSRGQFSPSKSDPKNRAENERKRQAAVAQKEKKEAEKRDKALVALEKKRQALASSKPAKIDTGATELVPMAPPLSSTAAPTPTYSPAAQEPSQSNSALPVYSQPERTLPPPSKAPTPRGTPDTTPGTTPAAVQPVEYKHQVANIPPLITHPTSLTHFSSSPQLQPAMDTTLPYLAPIQQPISPRTTATSISPTSPRTSTNEKNEKKEKKRNKSLLSAMSDDDPMAAADWWINHNQQIHQQHQRQTLLSSQPPVTRPHTASEYEENPLLDAQQIPGALTHTTPIQQATSASSTIVPFRLPPRTTDQKSPTPSPRLGSNIPEPPPTTQTSAYTYGTSDYASYQQQQQDIYESTLQSYQQQTAHHATLNQQNLGIDEHVQLYDDMGTSSGYVTPNGINGIAPGYYRATSTTTTYDQQQLPDGSLHYSHTQHQTEYVSTTPPSYDYDYASAYSQYPPPPTM